jgi:hypothetical protein
MNTSGLVSGCVLFALLAGLGSLALYLDRSQRPTLRCQLVLFLGAFALRLAMAIVIYQGGLVNLLGDRDSSYWVKGVALHQSWVAQGLGLRQLPQIVAEFFHKHHEGYYYLLGALFTIMEPARLPAAVFNGFLGSLTIVFVYRIAAILFSPAVAWRVGWWLCLFPSMVVWSSQTVKEPVVLVLEVYAIYAFIVYKYTSRPVRGILASIGSALALVPFRFYAAYAVLTSIAVASVLPFFARRRTVRNPSPAVLAATASLATAGVLYIMFKYAKLLRSIDSDFFLVVRSYYNRGGSGVLSTHDMRTLGGFVGGFLMGAAHLLLAPFPWQLAGGSALMRWTAPEQIVWWWLFAVGVVPGLWYVLRTRWADVVPILVLISMFVVLHGLVFGNIGYAFRQRVHLLPWLLMFAAVALERRATHS